MFGGEGAHSVQVRDLGVGVLFVSDAKSGGFSPSGEWQILGSESGENKVDVRFELGQISFADRWLSTCPVISVEPGRGSPHKGMPQVLCLGFHALGR